MNINDGGQKAGRCRAIGRNHHHLQSGHLPKPKPKNLSRLGRFLRDNGVKPSELADVTGISRQHLVRLRYGQCEPTRPVMIWLTIACRRLLGGRRRVRITELFDLGDGQR